MNLTPLDVRKATFRKVIRGWDPEEVAAFLEVVAENYEQVLQENAKLTERVEGLEERIRQYQGMERLLQDSMLTAERLAVESRDTSRRESEKRIQEAQKRAERILEDSRDRLRILNREIVELTQRKDLYVQRFRSLIQAQMLFFEDHQQDLNEINDLGQDVVDLLVQDAGNRQNSGELEAESGLAGEVELPEETLEETLGETAFGVEETVSEPTERVMEAQEPEERFEASQEFEAHVPEEQEDDKEVEVSRRGFFPPRVRRQGFFDLKADGETESTS